MDSEILQQIKKALLTRWQRFNKNYVIDIEDNSADAPQTEIIDIAQGLEQMDRDSSLQAQERKELLALERALAKMASGNFGVCEECSEEIPSKRLMVLPEARLCANCQAYEERQGMRIRVSGVASR